MMTLEDLADSSGVSARAISDLERGRTLRPHPRTIRMLAAALRIPESRLGPAVPDRRAANGKATAAEAGAPAFTAPGQLPAAARHFSGRLAELEMLSAWLNAPHGDAGSVAIAVICGAAGVGKTALAIRWAHDNVPRFPDGQLFVDLRGFGPDREPVTPAEAAQGFLHALNVPPDAIPADFAGQAARCRSMLGERRMLIVLDNACDVAQVRPLIPASPGSAVLVTSRCQLAGLSVIDGANVLSLDVLTDAEARQTLTVRLGAGRTRAEPDAATQLITLSGRLPLALGIIAARAAARPGWPLACIAAELRDVSGRLDALDAGEPTASLRAALSWTTRRLSSSAALMFALLSLHPGPDIAVAAAASLAGTSRPQARAALAELARVHVIYEPSPSRFAFHDLLRAYAAELARDLPADIRRLSIHRALDHYLHTAAAAAVLLDQIDPPGRPGPALPGVTTEQLADRQDAYTWFETERTVLLAVLQQAQDLGFYSHAIELPAALREFQIRRACWHDVTECQRLALWAAYRSRDRAAQAVSYRYLGAALCDLGEYEEAVGHLSTALDLYQLLGDQQGQCRCHFELARLSYRQGNVHQALACARQARRLARTTGHAGDEAYTLYMTGTCHLILGNYRPAQAHCDRAYILHRQAGSKLGEALTLRTLSQLAIAAGHIEDAVAILMQAIDACQQAGDRFHLADLHDALGDTYSAVGDLSSARSTWQQALAVLDELHHPQAQNVRVKLGPSTSRSR
jgi:tetratricopeptide (TPR) repeat protein/transcriptional regulator with XRE-family HTH domain